MLRVTRSVLGQAGGVVGDAAQGFADGQVTAKAKVGQVSTANVSTSESTPSISASVSDPWRTFFIETPLAPQWAEIRSHSHSLSTVSGDREHLQ
jgi:hypothetical protein